MNPKIPFSDKDLETLEENLQLLQDPFDPLDVSAIDGYLVGVLLQPDAIPPADWWPPIVDPEEKAQALMGTPAVAKLLALVQRRYDELNRAIRARTWFDPWVFEIDDGDATIGDSALPWVAGFAMAMDLFPALMALEPKQTLEPLALIYAHFDSDDLEDADELKDAIAELEPASTLTEAVEDLVSATLMLADVTRPPPPSAVQGAKLARDGGRAQQPRFSRPRR